jgi:hypothetical protein
MMSVFQWKIQAIVMILSDYRQSSDGRLDLLTTSNYNTTADFHILQITTAHAMSFQYAVPSLVVP